jgi:hypothetical protein
MTLKDILRVVEYDSLLSDANDLKNVKVGEKTIEDHKEYFKTQVDNKIKTFLLYIVLTRQNGILYLKR